MTSRRPDPTSNDPVVDHLRAYLGTLGQPEPDDSVKGSIIAGAAAEALAHQGVVRRIGRAVGVRQRTVARIGIAAMLLLVAGVGFVLYGAIDGRSPAGDVVAVEAPSTSVTAVPAPTTTAPSITTTVPAPTTTAPSGSTTTVPPITTTVPAPTTTAPVVKPSFERVVPTITIPPPPPSVASEPVCYGTVWMGGLPAGPDGADAVAISTGLRVAFTMQRVPEGDGWAAVGVESISHPSAVLWLQVGSLHYRITAEDLPWRGPTTDGAKAPQIAEFGVCLGE